MSSPTIDRAAWLEARRTGCGASDVAGILGESPWASPWSVWADKCGLTPLDDDAERDIDDPMTFGRDLEEIIAERYERQTGLYVVAQQEVIHHPDEPWRFATVDGLVTESESHRARVPESFGEPATVIVDSRGVTGDALAVFESKYTSDHPWDEIPRHYVLAGMWQMHVTGLTAVHFGVLHLPFGRPMFRTYELELDGTLLAEIIERVEAFWLEHVVTGRPPDPDAHPATAKAITAAWGHDTTQKLPRIHLDDHESLVAEYKRLKAQEKVLKWQMEKVANGLKHLIGERGQARPVPELTHVLSDAYIGDELAVSWRSEPDNRIDTKAVRADHGTKYDTTGTKRVLRLHGRYQP